MELISTISDVILYFSIALIVVVIFSYILFNYISNKNNEEDNNIVKEREKIRQYIINQQKILQRKTATDSEEVSSKIYAAPTFSGSDLQYQMQAKHRKEISSLRDSVSIKRYKIINKTKDSELAEESLNKFRDSHPLFKESKHYGNS